MTKATTSISLASCLIVVAAVVFILIGLFELTNYFFQTSPNFFEVFFYASIGIGLFEKHTWSRTLGMITSTLTILSGLYFLIASGEVFWNGSSVGWGDGFVLVAIIVHSCLLYVLSRNDVKNQFIQKETR